MGYLVLNKLEQHEMTEGVKLRLISGDQMTMAFFHLAPGAVIPEHAHPNEQMGTVLKGSILLTIGGEEKTVAAGIVYRVPSNVPHSGRCLGVSSEVLEIFSPPREDLLQKFKIKKQP
ncbi:MAG: hypothetical protein A2V65_05800 [Deltaproteobacteria bacterium RBG_13_49_15]|nr:MAG: hypothetical protein A2V65_05800 [Deltaproteobacteria bacterium RBG_13_49_15]